MTAGRRKRTALIAAVLAAAAPAAVRASDPNLCDVPGEAPDLILGRIDTVQRVGTVGDVTAYAIGATSCNLGTCQANWFASTPQHPVFAQNLFRLKDGRFEQLGQSWAAHRFFALSQSICEPGCIATGGQHLGVNCSTADAANYAAAQVQLGAKSDIDASAGTVPHPFTGQGGTGDAIYKRLQVRHEDLEPSQNAGAVYFIEAHVVARDDAAAGNGLDNASHRQVLVQDAGGGVYQLAVTGPTEVGVGLPAIHAWAAHDAAVVLEGADVPGDGRYWVASRATDVGGGLWRYQYAVHNLDSDRAAMRLEVPVRAGAVIANPAFHDVDYHSGEQWHGTDWTAVVDEVSDPHAIVWSTETAAENPQANALRWGTLYNFEFETDAPPGSGSVTLALFKPRSPAEIFVSATVPQLCDADGSCEAGEEPCLCGGDCGAPPEEEAACGDARDDDCDGRIDCLDADCCFAAGCDAGDADFDTFALCEDCDDANASTWQIPGEVGTLQLNRDGEVGARLSWGAPDAIGGTTVFYEVLRGPTPAVFGPTLVCLDLVDSASPSTMDAEAPPPGAAYGYLVRASNGCGPGSLGTASDGTPHPSLVCP